MHHYFNFVESDLILLNNIIVHLVSERNYLPLISIHTLKNSIRYVNKI